MLVTMQPAALPCVSAGRGMLSNLEVVLFQTYTLWLIRELFVQPAFFFGAVSID